MESGTSMQVRFSCSHISRTNEHFVAFVPDPSYWAMCLQNLLWIRNHVVAPLSEEFTFRACMMPLLLQSFKPLTAVAITPMFFGIGHLHHIIERLRAGLPLKTILIVSGKRL